jgi:hypothetical protein
MPVTGISLPFTYENLVLSVFLHLTALHSMRNVVGRLKGGYGLIRQKLFWQSSLIGATCTGILKTLVPSRITPAKIASKEKDEGISVSDGLVRHTANELDAI